MKKKMVLTMVALFCVAVFGMSSANAGFIPYNIDDTGDFLNLPQSYFNGASLIEVSEPPLDFTGEWQYTAIAYESGNINITENNSLNGPATFSTNDLSNWGTWRDVNFDDGNIYFTDNVNGPTNIEFNPYTDAVRFMVYQLTADSKDLDYLLPNDTFVLSAGTYIIGWNDNINDSGLAQDGGDTDYDDIIIAMRPKMPVPEPASMLLLGLGLVGLAGLSRRFKK